MFRNALRHSLAAMLCGMYCYAPISYALVVEPGFGAGMEYTDNAALTPDDEHQDLIGIGYISAKVQETTGSVIGTASTALTYNHYTQNTFDDEYNFDLSASGTWEMLRDRFIWQLQDYFTQRPINSLGPNTPVNIQDTNTFSFGPNIRFAFPNQQKLNVRALYRNFYYENSDTDNQQYALQAFWLNQKYRALDIGLDGDVTRVVYDQEQRYPSYTINNLHLVLSSQRVRSNYITLNLGATFIDRGTS
ncbi:MAG: hypothetical protein IPK65_08680 [Gammaproteobacteria bacterium]|nr:hypothetical protein [Gammaproteobacteria bacterium]